MSPRRFVARHRWGVGRGRPAARSVVGAAAVTFSVQAARLAEERDRTARERDTAQQVVAFLTGLFEVSNPDRAAAARSPRASCSIAAPSASTRELAGQPVVQARLLGTIGTVYGSLGIYDRSAALLERGARTAAGHARPRTPRHGARRWRSWPRRIASWRASRKPRRCTARRWPLKRRLGASPSSIASSLNNLGLTLSERGTLRRRRAAAARGHRHLAGARRTDGARRVAVGLNNLASILRQQGRLDDAVPMLEQAIAIRRQRLGNGHPGWRRCSATSGQVFNAKGELAKAEPLLREALAIRRRAYGDDHPDTVTAVNNLTSLLHDQGDLAAAEPLYRAALGQRRQAPGHDAPRLRRAAQQSRHPARGLAALRRSRTSLPRVAGGAPRSATAPSIRPWRAWSTTWGGCCWPWAAPPRPRSLAAHGPRRRKRMLPAGHFEIALSLAVLGEVMVATRRSARRAAAGRSARDRARQSSAPSIPRWPTTLLALSALVPAAGTPARGRALAARGRRNPRRQAATGHWKRAVAEVELASVLIALGRRARPTRCSPAPSVHWRRTRRAGSAGGRRARALLRPASRAASADRRLARLLAGRRLCERARSNLGTAYRQLQ